MVADLYGVPFGDGSHGADDITAQFTIGRSQIVRADTQTHRFTVIRDGEQVADYPASYGLDSDPDRVTRGGTHVVMEKTPATLFSNPKFDYTDLPVQRAVRISNNGEFIHSAPWSVWAQGKQNVSHGCLNLAPDDAVAYYESALTGDPVEVIGSTEPLTAADGDYYDWTLSWQEWTSKSADYLNPGISQRPQPRIIGRAQKCKRSLVTRELLAVSVGDTTGPNAPRTYARSG